jgi:undecaprenyl diphosphate synthase
MVPRHIAIIMDGNGRWARKKGLPKVMGHAQGVKTLHEIVAGCIKFGVKYLTVYAFSSENWHRPNREIKAIFGLLDKFLDEQMGLFHENNVKLRIIGDINKIDSKLRKKIERAEKDTVNNSALVLTVALSYGSRQEIVNAVRTLSQQVKKGTINPSEIDEETFSSCLYTKGCPDPDLLIRTSGEMRISNFLLWQISYAEMYVTEKLWPDFREADLEKAIEEYRKRERRFGR